MPYKNIEDKRKQSRDWAKKNYVENEKYREYRSEYGKQWRANNPDKVKEQKKRYAEKHAEFLKAKSYNYYWNVRKAYLKEHPAYYTETARLQNQRKAKLRKEALQQLRMDMGGKCTHCGYSEDTRILQFHHIGDKAGDVASTQSIVKMQEEAKKCILLCPNCHAIETLKKHNENI